MYGHFSGEVCGLASNPTKEEFITSGGDRTIRKWDAI